MINILSMLWNLKENKNMSEIEDIEKNHINFRDLKYNVWNKKYIYVPNGRNKMLDCAK